MTYRGVYQDGVVILQGDVDLQNGAWVEVNPARASKRLRGEKLGTRPRLGARSKARAKSSAVHPFVALAGLWQDRPEWRGKTSVEIVEELRRRSEQPPKRKRGRRG